MIITRQTIELDTDLYFRVLQACVDNRETFDEFVTKALENEIELVNDSCSLDKDVKNVSTTTQYATGGFYIKDDIAVKLDGCFRYRGCAIYYNMVTNVFYTNDLNSTKPYYGFVSEDSLDKVIEAIDYFTDNPSPSA